MSDHQEAQVIDFAPRLRKKKQSECRHENVVVDDDAAELECSDCGAPLDPWWYIRRLAAQDAETERKVQEQQKRYELWCENANETQKRLHGEITRLTRLKDELWNQKAPDGRPLGAVAASRRRRRRVDANPK